MVVTGHPRQALSHSLPLGGLETTLLEKGRESFPYHQCLVTICDRSTWQKSLPGLARLERCLGAVLLSGGSREGSVSLLIRVVGKFQFFTVVGTRVPFPC